MNSSKETLLFLFILIGGCVYYNTFFNAQQYFKEAQEMQLNSKGKPSSQAVQNYNKAIKKCGIVLTDYKDSKYADDALFLMARSLFYIGRNYTQTIAKLNDLIKFYPDSEFIPEAKLYLAKAKYEFNQKEESYEILRNFIQNKEHQKYHARALKILADYKLREESYVEAESYLEKIIQEHQRSNEFESAYILLGKTLSDAGKFEASNQTFLELLDSKVSRKNKFDARYFIAKNYLALKEYQEAKRTATKLLADEYREDKISKVRLIEARALANLEQAEDAIAIFNAIIEDNPNTELSAEASFFLAELYFNQKKDYEKAIEYYNKVKEEKNNSFFVQQALTKSSVASQIIQYYNPEENTSIEDLVKENFQLAEYYIDILEQPDSAIFVYNSIIERGDELIPMIDSLQTKLDSIHLKIDSLDIVDSVNVAMQDSSAVEKSSEELQTLKTADNDLKNSIANFKSNLEKYENEFIPFARFAKLWIYHELKNDEKKASQILDILKVDSPQNKYTFASEQLLKGEPVEIISEDELQVRDQYDQAVKKIDSDLDQAIKIFQEISGDTLHTLYSDKAKFALGYLFAFTLEDTIQSKPYFDDLLQSSENSEIKQKIASFYKDGNFLHIERLPKIVEMEKEAEQKEQEEMEKQEKEEKENSEEQQDETSANSKEGQKTKRSEEYKQP